MTLLSALPAQYRPAQCRSASITLNLELLTQKMKLEAVKPFRPASPERSSAAAVGRVSSGSCQLKRLRSIEAKRCFYKGGECELQGFTGITSCSMQSSDRTMSQDDPVPPPSQTSWQRTPCKMMQYVLLCTVEIKKMLVLLLPYVALNIIHYDVGGGQPFTRYRNLVWKVSQ